MRAMRGMLAALVAAAGLVAPRAEAAAPVLAGRNVIRASRPAVVDVRLPRAATVATPFGSSPDLAVTARGALTAFVLVGASAANRHVTLVGGAAGPASERFLLPVPQFPAPGGGSFETVKTFGDLTTVPAGAYRLYVVPGGAGASITLRLRGLPGRATIVPAKAATAEVAGADPAPVGVPAGTGYAAAVARTLRKPGLALQVLRSRIDVAAAWQLVMCHDNPGRAVVSPPRGTPGCPSGEKHTVVNHRAPETDADTKHFVQAFAGLPAGGHGVSAVHVSEGVVSSLGYVTLWLTY